MFAVIKKFPDFILISQFHPSPYRLISTLREPEVVEKVENCYILFLVTHQICLNDNRHGQKHLKNNLFWRGLTMVLTPN